MSPIQRTALVVFSGGQDSTTCLHWAREKFSKVMTVTFDYGQRHSVELQQSRIICSKLGVTQKFLNLSEMGLFADNALLSSETPIKNAEGSEIPNTFVPARNLVFLTLAASYAVRNQITDVVLGACQTDFSGYPDCRQEFIDSFVQTTRLALGTKDFTVHTPLMNLSKAEIFELAKSLNALESVIEDSHTCYQGDRVNRHPWGFGCGTCPACLLRKKGFEEFLLNRKFV
jgi:7-cyano-7-deazaguanine synthase